MFNKLKQFKDLRDQAKHFQDELSKESENGSALGGDIQITLDGNLVMTNFTIAESLLTPDKKDKVVAGVKDAYSDALKKIQRTMAVKMKEMGGLPKIPGLS